MLWIAAQHWVQLFAIFSYLQVFGTGHSTNILWSQKYVACLHWQNYLCSFWPVCKVECELKCYQLTLINLAECHLRPQAGNIWNTEMLCSPPIREQYNISWSGMDQSGASIDDLLHIIYPISANFPGQISKADSHSCKQTIPSPCLPSLHHHPWWIPWHCASRKIVNCRWRTLSEEIFCKSDDEVGKNK